MSDEDLVKVNDSTEEVDDSTKERPIKRLRSIFDCKEGFTLWTDPADSMNYWKCNWCGKSYSQRNSTKALSHITGLNGGKHVSACTKIHATPPPNVESYKELLSHNAARQRGRYMANASQEVVMEKHNNLSASALAEARKRKSSSSISSMSSFLEKLKHIYVKMPSTASSSQKNSIGTGGMQLLISSVGAGPVVQSENQLTMAISDMIHSLGLPFSLGSEPKFCLVLNLARNVSMQYKPPGRNVIANDLLDLNYKQYTDQNKKKLLNESEIYGLTFFGDGATVKKMPLFNILASGVHSLSSCLEIVKCTGHICNGGKKMASILPGYSFRISKALKAKRKMSLTW